MSTNINRAPAAHTATSAPTLIPEGDRTFFQQVQRLAEAAGDALDQTVPNHARLTNNRLVYVSLVLLKGISDERVKGILSRPEGRQVIDALSRELPMAYKWSQIPQSWYR